MIFHTKNQIISIIAAVFLEKYDVNDLEKARSTWKENEKKLEQNIPAHYVFDIISQEWGEGGIGRVYTIINNNKYLKPISKQNWEAMLNSWFENQLDRQENKRVANPKLSGLLFLNCIYTPIFSAKDQLSKNKFDIEHIAAKNYMLSLIKNNNWEQGLPISCVSNLCYLPQYANRSKKDKNFYQDDKYLKKILLEDIENKFSFTKRSDLQWMDKTYAAKDEKSFANTYKKFLRSRFETQKEKFYSSMNIK